MPNNPAKKIFALLLGIIILVGFTAGDTMQNSSISGNTSATPANSLQNSSEGVSPYTNSAAYANSTITAPDYNSSNSVLIPIEMISNSTNLTNQSAGNLPTINQTIVPANNSSGPVDSGNSAGNFSSDSKSSNTTVIPGSNLPQPPETPGSDYAPLSSGIASNLSVNSGTNSTDPCGISAGSSMINTSIVESGQIEVQAQLPSSCNTSYIQKQDIIENSTSKEVVISSPVHVEHPLTVYTDIPEIYPNQTSSVKIFWENENLSIAPTGFYDTNGNGMYNRISWIVPHLSTQIFQVNVNLGSMANSTSQSIILNVTAPKNGTIVSDPVNFSISVNYTGYNNLTCNLYVLNGSTSYQQITINQTGYNFAPISLQNGEHNWSVDCSDTNNSAKASANGYFSVNQRYSVSSGLPPLYVIDQNYNLVGNPNTTVNINSNGSMPDLKLYRGNSSLYDFLSYPNSTFNVAPYINQEGDYNLSIIFPGGNTTSVAFSVAQANITENESQINAGDSLGINVNVLYPSSMSLSSPVPISMNFGDGSPQTFGQSNPSTFVHQYSSGNYTVSSSIYFSGIQNPFTVTLPISVGGGPSAPLINIENPANNQVISGGSAVTNFTYSLSPVADINNCTASVYGPAALISGGTNYPLAISSSDMVNTTQNPDVSFPLTQFDNGTYYWNVECADTIYPNINSSSSNYYFIVGSGNSSLYSSAIVNNSYPQQPQVELALSELNNFTSAEQTYSLDQMNALNDLGISANLTYFAKRLAQIDQDLSTNVNYITDPVKKAQTISSETAEIQDIVNSIPQNLTVSQSTEFIKNSITTPLDQIVKTYARNNSLPMSNYQVGQLAQLNFNIQKYITVDTSVKQVQIAYANSTQDMTLVSQQVNITNSSFNTIIEAIPANISSNVVFLTPATPIGNSMYEISADSPSWNGQIVYYFTPSLNDINEVKQADAVLFENVAVSSSGLTGFVIQSLGSGFSPWYYPVILALLMIFIYTGRKTTMKVRLSGWKKEENVNRVLENIERARKALKDENNVEVAKEAYHRIKQVFALTPAGFRKRSMEEIEKIRKGIDRREIISFVKEYEKARLQGRENDARVLYGEIKRTYRRLPKADQEKVYKKMFGGKWEL